MPRTILEILVYIYLKTLELRIGSVTCVKKVQKSLIYRVEEYLKGTNYPYHISFQASHYQAKLAVLNLV